jgi:hypothetical protein
MADRIRMELDQRRAQAMHAAITGALGAYLLAADRREAAWDVLKRPEGMERARGRGDHVGRALLGRRSPPRHVRYVFGEFVSGAGSRRCISVRNTAPWSGG